MSERARFERSGSRPERSRDCSVREEVINVAQHDVIALLPLILIVANHWSIKLIRKIRNRSTAQERGDR
jgi:hypothetical protein